METHYEKYGRKWYEQNKQKNLERGRKWNKSNRAKRVAITQKYVRFNKEKVAAYNKQFSLSVEGKYRQLKHRHIKRGWTDSLLSIDSYRNLFSATCFYCDSTTGGGLDRVNNECGYTHDNVVPCCELCNHMKWKISQTDFLSHIKKIYVHGN